MILLWKLDNLACDSKRIPLYTNVPQINTLLSSEILYHACQTKGAKAQVINKVILEDNFGNLVRNEVNSPHLNMHVTSLCSSWSWWQEYIELYKKDLHNPDNHNGVITHLEPDILECEVKWALGSITMNKASRGDGNPVELFQILKDDAVTVLHSICQQTWKLSSGHRTGKAQFSFQSQRKAMQTMLKLPHKCTHLTH